MKNKQHIILQFPGREKSLFLGYSPYWTPITTTHPHDAYKFRTIHLALEHAAKLKKLGFNYGDQLAVVTIPNN